MQHDSVIQLYPLPSAERPLSGLYLSHNLRQYGSQGRPFVYSNFVVTLDGRIAITRSDKKGMRVPEQTANDRDWRLFQELVAQADMIISSGRYLRQWAAGEAQEILQVDDPRYDDLHKWRQQQGLPPQPDLAIVSRNLDFPIPNILKAGGRKVVVFTTANPDLQRVKEIEAKAGQVIVAGNNHTVKGDQLVQQMAGLGYHIIYSAAGPQIMHLLLEENVLDRLYLTQAHQLLGGEIYATVVEGALLDTSVGLSLNAIYYDSYALDGWGQLFTSYNQARRPQSA